LNNGQTREVIEALRQGGIVALNEKDMFSLWVKTSCCNMDSRQLSRVADIAEKYGRGCVLFTTRQTPHIPFVNLKDVAEVKQELAKVELELDRCGPRVRNLNVCYTASLCRFAKMDCISLGERLENFFRNEIVHKVKIGVAGCERDCIAARVLTDVGFVATAANGVPAYDAYVGGRLGVNAAVGEKMGEGLSEQQCVRLVQNYIDLLATGLKGERGADLIRRLGTGSVRQTLNVGIDRTTEYGPVACPTKVETAAPGVVTIRIRATCGEVTSAQLRRIAEISDHYGLGFVHFGIRGAPEIPGVDPVNMGSIRAELESAGMEVLEGGIDNIQSCYAGYCSEGLADAQTLLKRLEPVVAELGLVDPAMTISASGCPNSCGIAHLSEIGFHGVVEPDIDVNACTGCELCLAVCKRKAISLRGNLGTIDMSACRYCGQCIAICPSGAIREKRKGFAVLVGGKAGEDTRLGETIAQFVSEDKAFELGRRCLMLARDSRSTVAEIIDTVGIVGFKTMLSDDVERGSRPRAKD
jgi:dissimilatory sulfite reductase (desulfoviridin) alpha/beta subunit